MRFVPLLLLAFLAACGSSEEAADARALIADVEPDDGAYGAAPVNKFGFAEAMQQGPGLFGSNAPNAAMAVASVTPARNDGEPARPEIANAPAQQQIAYAYGFGFRIDRDKIDALQKAHSAMCEAMGPKCRILRISQGKSDWDSYGEVKLQLAATEAGSFEKALTEPAVKLGGELVSSVRDGEDLSESIIDTEAHLQSRMILRDKLTAILKNNRGSVDELVKAEKAVADVNEELDSTRAKLEKYRSRIRFSDVSIEYQPNFGESQLGFSRPVMTALRSVGTTLGTTTAVLIYVLTALVPITLLILAIRWVLHRFGLRIRFWRRDATKVEAAS